MKRLMLGEILSRNDLRTLTGGIGTCASYIPAGQRPNGGTYTGSSMHYNNGSYTWYGISKEEALQMTSGVSGAKWCCDSCGSASWY